MSRDYSRTEILDLVEGIAKLRGIPPEDFLRFAFIETGGAFDEKASHGENGSKGLFQFAPKTAEQYGIAGREFDPVANIEAAVCLYLDNRRAIVRSHEMSGRPYLSRGEEPGGLDMYLAHQQGAGGYRSLQAAIAEGRFTRRDTRALLLNKISARDMEAVVGIGYDALVRLPDRELAQAFVRYWKTKFGHIRIPEKSIEPADSQRQVRDSRATYGEGIALSAAYDLTVAHDPIGYGFGSKSLDGSRIDCSGWVVEMINATYTEINRKSGMALFEESDFYSLGNDAAASIVRKSVQGSGILLEGGDVVAAALREGMVIGEDNGGKAWDKGRFKGIDHIAMVVRDPDSGELMVSQSRSGEGVEIVPLDDYLAYKHRHGVMLFASDPLSDARTLLHGEKEHAVPGHGDDAMRRAIAALNAISHELAVMEVEAERASGPGQWLGHAGTDHAKEGNGPPYRRTLNDPGHADYPLFLQAYDGLKQLRELDFDGEECFVNAAACMAAQAKAAGLGRLDHVMQDANRRSLTVVQGRIDDPGSRWVHVDRTMATLQPMHLSTIQADRVQETQPTERRPDREAPAAIGL